ncbi:hypothetical protein [Corallococcus sp. RDP092CA]|uniref:hypothetical protein n=1 Tax=Corallococcus sp. RDP092CA TaxID=3109369 RepID=UPI0035AF752E
MKSFSRHALRASLFLAACARPAPPTSVNQRKGFHTQLKVEPAHRAPARSPRQRTCAFAV